MALKCLEYTLLPHFVTKNYKYVNVAPPLNVNMLKKLFIGGEYNIFIGIF